MPKPPGGLVQAVQTGSVAWSSGLQPGDRLLSINGHPLRDVIDVRYYSAEEALDLVVERGGRRIEFHAAREYGQDLGISFATATFDSGIRRCANNCDFCFVKQNARRMRRSLYVKDDDYRYSFLSGSFVTLTNLTSDDWERLEEQRLSPLYVSVHATDQELRRRFLGRKNSPDILEQLQRLAKLGIEVHTQVVLVPGVNEGQHLVRTIADLTALAHSPVESVGIVPVGLTKHHTGGCRVYRPEEALALLNQIEPLREENRRRWGISYLYPSDEWYLVAGREPPPAGHYNGFPQLENGVGLVRQLLDEWDELKPDLSPADSTEATFVCGTLLAPVLERIVEEWNQRAGGNLRLVPVVNEFFGPAVTVSGLLTGRDVLLALQSQELGDAVLLPRAMFVPLSGSTAEHGAGSIPPGTTLDDVRLADMAKRLHAPAEMAGSLAEARIVLRKYRRD